MGRSLRRQLGFLRHPLQPYRRLFSRNVSGKPAPSAILGQVPQSLDAPRLRRLPDHSGQAGQIPAGSVRIGRHPAHGRGQLNISRSIGPSKIVGKRHADNSRYPTAIEAITLNDNHRASETRTGANRLPEISPPHISLRYYHSACLRIRSPALATIGSRCSSIASSA